MLNKVAKSKLYDLVATSALILWFALGIIGSIIKISELGEGAPPLELFSRIATVALLGLVTLFLIIRSPVVSSAKGLLPRLAAIAGCVLPSFLALLPPVNLSPAMAGFSSTVIFLGLIASIIAVLFLGRSFSVLPQARRLVVQGPYRIVRHPLYLAELIVVLGVMWRFEQPWPQIILCIAIGVQVLRMRFEERVLLDTFPGYREYAARTARLVPRIY